MFSQDPAHYNRSNLSTKIESITLYKLAQTPSNKRTSLERWRVIQIKYKSEFLYEQRKHSKEEYGPDCKVSNTKFSSVILKKLAMKARERIL